MTALSLRQIRLLRQVRLVRLVLLHATSRRVPASLAALTVCAVGLWLTLHGHWDAYGALQVPLIFETGCAAVVAITTASPFGDPERAAGHGLPALRLGLTLALTAAAVVALDLAGTGQQLAGGAADVLRNVAGLTGIGLLCALALGGRLAWTGPIVYLFAGLYGLYSDWHPPALTTPWLWPARPPGDLGGALCAAAVFAAGLTAITIRGARDPAGE